MSKVKHARVTEDVLAEAAGKSVRTIRRHADRGTIMRGPDGLYDRELALQQIRGATAAGRPRKDAGSDEGGDAPAKRKRNWLEVRTREDALKARLQRMELQGKLVRRSAVEATWADQATQVRDQLLQLGPRMADRLAAETDPRVCSQLVTDEVTAALRSLSEVG